MTPSPASCLRSEAYFARRGRSRDIFVVMKLSRAGFVAINAKCTPIFHVLSLQPSERSMRTRQSGNYGMARRSATPRSTPMSATELKPTRRMSHPGSLVDLRVRVYPEFASIAGSSIPLGMATGNLCGDATDSPIARANFGFAGMSRMSNSSCATCLEAGCTTISP